MYNMVIRLFRLAMEKRKRINYKLSGKPYIRVAHLERVTDNDYKLKHNSSVLVQKGKFSLGTR